MTPVTQASGACPHCGHEVSGTYTVGTIRPGSMLHYNQYLVGDVIGQGGFGITYIGEDIGLGIPVAIKEFFPNGSATRDNRTSTVYGIGVQGENAVYSAGKNKFLQEAKNLARFSGTPGIVDVKSVFEENNTAYIVMQYISGKTLNEYVNANGIVSQDRLLKMMQPVMNALKEIHSKNLIHRDISPDNLKFNGNTLTLIDFGSARIESSEANKSLSVVVKHGFAPIEQYQSHGTQGPWTDIYALCATMYWCLTGKLPPAAPDRVIEDNLKRPSDLSISLTEPFERALLKGLSFRPKDRYQTIEEMATDMYKVDEKAEAARKANEARIAREKQAEAERQERERKAEALRVEREKKAEAERIARERKAEEERKQRAQREEQLRIEKEKKAAALKAEQERKAEEQRISREKKAEAKKRAEEEKAEKQRQAAEKKAQKAQIKKTETAAETKKSRNLPAILAAVLVIAIAAGIVMAKAVIPKQRTEKAYQNGIILMESGQYDDAIAAFEALGDYKDSASKIHEAEELKIEKAYSEAEKLLSDKKYDEAAAAFEALGEYGDAEGKIKEALYMKASEYYDSGDYKSAYIAFKELGDYSDSAEKADQSIIGMFSECEVGDTVYFGAYEQDNDTSNGEEDIEWLVLAKERKKVLVISKYALDCQPYNWSYKKYPTWETCSLRRWLNGTFISAAFSSEEKNMIQSMTDQVFLLSIAEAEKYFSSDSARQCQGTAYCYAQGAHKADNGNCWWWLRSPGEAGYGGSAAGIRGGGSVNFSGNYVSSSDNAVRPAMWIDTVQIGSTITFGVYEQDNDTSNGKEEIEWIVLDKDNENGKVLLLSRYCLDVKPFTNTSSSGAQYSTWATCSLRNWLNGVFYNSAFSQEERRLIADTINDNSSELYSDIDQGSNTTDRVFILSADEAMYYFESNTERKAAATDYVQQITAKDQYDNIGWWVRTVVIHRKKDMLHNWGFNHQIGFIGASGDIRPHSADVNNVAVRPAMWVDISKIG